MWRTLAMALVLAAAFTAVEPTFAVIYGYFDYRQGDFRGGGLGAALPTIDYISTAAARSLYEMQLNTYEGRDSFIFLGYAFPVPYSVEPVYTDALDGIGQFAGPTDVDYVHICDEPYLAGLTKAEVETMIAHAKSRLPDHKFAISFGRPDSNIAAKGGLPAGLDYALLNWYPFTDVYGTPPQNQAEFDAETAAMLASARTNMDPNTKIILVPQGFKNTADSNPAPPPGSIAWYANWVDSEADIVGLIVYKYNSLSGQEQGTKELDDTLGGYIAAQSQVGYNWGITTSLNPPAPTRPPLPSTFDRQQYKTFVQHEGWDGHAGSTAWFGVFGGQAHSGIQSLRVRSTNQQPNHISRDISSGPGDVGKLDFYCKITHLTGAGFQIVGLFPQYSGDDVAGTQQFLLIADGNSSNYQIYGKGFQTVDSGLPITGDWDHIVINWDVTSTNDVYQLYVNGAGPATILGTGDVTEINGVRIFASQDGSIPDDGQVFDPPPGSQMFIDDFDHLAGEPLVGVFDSWVEDWEQVTSRYYPLNWTHSGGGDAGTVTSGAGVGGSEGMRIVAEADAFDGYSRQFTPTYEGTASWQFSVESYADYIHVTDLGDADLWPRFELYTKNGNYYYIGWNGWVEVDTGIAVATGGQFDTIEYNWFSDNTDELFINGTEIVDPGGFNHRAYGIFGDPMQASVFRFGVQGGGAVAIWDNIRINSPEPVCGDPNHPYPTGDLNQNCYVNWEDFSLFAGQWLASGCGDPDWCGGADLTQDSDVNWQDFSVFASHWLECTDPDPPCSYNP